MSKKAVLAALALSSIGLVGCTAIPAGQQAVKIDSWGAPTVSGCAAEETYVSALGNDIRMFPARQIAWDANNDPGAERGPYLALSNPSAQAEMAIPVTITFDLTTNCDKLKEFYRNYATIDNGWLNDDGTNSDGWKKLLTRVVSQPAEQSVITVTQKYPWQKVWNDEAVRAEYVRELTSTLPKESAARTGGNEYFTNFRVTVGKPYPTKSQLKDSAELQQANAAAAEAERIKLTSQADAQRQAAESQKNAEIAKRDAQLAAAQVREAEIAGFGTGPGALDAYLRDKCRQEQTCHQYDPSPIIAGAR